MTISYYRVTRPSAAMSASPAGSPACCRYLRKTAAFRRQLTCGVRWVRALGPDSDEVMTSMARVVVIGDLMTDAIAHATLPLPGQRHPGERDHARGGSGANIAAWMAATGRRGFVGRRGADIAGRTRHGAHGLRRDARCDGPGAATGTCVVMVTHKGERRCCPTPAPTPPVPGRPAARPVRAGRPPARFRYTLLSEGARRRPGRDRLRQRTNMTASVDGASAAPLGRAGRALPRAFLRAVLLFVNAAQATVLTGG